MPLKELNSALSIVICQNQNYPISISQLSSFGERVVACKVTMLQYLFLFWQILCLAKCTNIANIDFMSINAYIEMRYAVTNVTIQVWNNNASDGTFSFDLDIPHEAFVSFFSVNVGNNYHEAKLITMEETGRIFNESNSSVRGLVQRKSTSLDSQLVIYLAKKHF